MKTSITIFINIIFLSCLYSQGNYNGSNVPYVSCTNCTGSNFQYSAQIEHYDTEQIISDFGPRYISANTPYDFHGGIDYTATIPNTNPPNDLGYHIAAIEGGTIFRLENYNNGNLKYVVIDGPGNNDYGYLHLFDDTALPTTIGDMKYTEINDTFPISADPTYGIYDITNNILLSDCGGGACDSSFYYVHAIGDTIYATNQVAANDRIGILGTSGNVGSHLHLSKYNTLSGITDFVNNDANAVDPLETCAHEGPYYNIKIHHDSTGANIDQYPENVLLAYPGNNPSSILIRPIMPDMFNGQVNNGILSNTNRYYLDNTMNIHKTEIFMKYSTDQNFDYIQGPFYQSKFHLGSRLNENIKYPPHISVRNANNLGSWTRTGIHPVAYKTNNPRRWDDFYFADFVTRIHKNTVTMIANCPDDARYPDGSYDLFAQVTDVRDSLFHSDTLSFILDNWKPYIKDVVIFIGSALVYDEDWTCNQDCIEFSNRSLNTDLSQVQLENDMEITVTTSEPLTSLSLYFTKVAKRRYNEFTKNISKSTYFPGVDLRKDYVKSAALPSHKSHSRAIYSV